MNETNGETISLSAGATQRSISATPLAPWTACHFLSCSVLPIRRPGDCDCPFCSSKLSIRGLERKRVPLPDRLIEQYFLFARSRGAGRLIITGGGEPLSGPDEVLRLVRIGKHYFDEIVLSTNGAFLTPELAADLREAGLAYFCFLRHHYSDDANRALMGDVAPDLIQFVDNTGDLPIRAICVMTRGDIDSQDKVWSYMDILGRYGIDQFTFKRVDRACPQSLFHGADQDHWIDVNRVDVDPFANEGRVIDTLPWGPQIRRLGHFQVCYYHEPDPIWERSHSLCRSSNLMPDGKVYASLEDQQSLLFQVND